MHVFVCPKCGHKIPSGRPVAHVPVRCDECGMVFHGSTIEAPGEAPAPRARSGDKSSQPRRAPTQRPSKPDARPSKPAPAESEAAAALASAVTRRPVRPHYVARKRKKSLAIPIFVSVLGIAALAVMMVVLGEHVGAPPPPAANEPDRQEREPRRSKARPPEQENGPAASPGKTDADKTAPRRPAALPSGDEKVTVSRWGYVLDVGDQVGIGTLVGRLRNTDQRMVERAAVRLRLIDKRDGKPLARDRHVVCRNIPPGRTVGFSAGYNFESPPDMAEEDIGLQSSVKAELADASTVGWMAEASVCAIDVRGDTVYVVTGPAKNPKAFDVVGVKVYADFFHAKGMHKGTATGTLDKRFKGRIRKGKNATFTVEFDTEQTDDVVPQDIGVFQIRIIGQRSKE